MAKIFLSAQNFDIFDNDSLDPFARTGAISSEMLFRVGAEGVILGHSEVGDSPDVTGQKLFTIFSKQKRYGAKFLAKSTILVGESWEEYEKSTINEIGNIVKNRLHVILRNLPFNFVKNLVLGYEPKWGSRGSGRDDMPPPEPELISVCIRRIKKYCIDHFGKKAVNIAVIYGGRSTPERTETILKDENIEGLILGSACNSVQKTMKIAKIMKKIRPQKRKILHANFKAYSLSDSYENYLRVFKRLNSSFTIYLSPPYTDIYQVKTFL